MLNKIYLSGNLGSAPEIRKTSGGKEIATLSLATQTSWKNDQGEWQSHTDWHKIAVFRESIVEWIKGSLRKGDNLLIEGKLSYGEVEDKFGQKRKIACIVVSGREGQVHLLRPGRVEGSPPTVCSVNEFPCHFPANQNAVNQQGSNNPPSPKFKDTAISPSSKTAPSTSLETKTAQSKGDPHEAH